MAWLGRLWPDGDQLRSTQMIHRNPFTDCALCRVKKLEEVEMDHRQEQRWIGIQASTPKVWIFLSHKAVYRSTDWWLNVPSLRNTLWYATYHTHLYLNNHEATLVSAIGVDRSPVRSNRNRWMAAMRIIFSWMYSKIHYYLIFLYIYSLVYITKSRVMYCWIGNVPLLWHCQT